MICRRLSWQSMTPCAPWGRQPVMPNSQLMQSLAGCSSSACCVQEQAYEWGYNIPFSLTVHMPSGIQTSVVDASNYTSALGLAIRECIIVCILHTIMQSESMMPTVLSGMHNAVSHHSTVKVSLSRTAVVGPEFVAAEVHLVHAYTGKPVCEQLKLYEHHWLSHHAGCSIGRLLG